jgi:hypothetical protein
MCDNDAITGKSDLLVKLCKLLILVTKSENICKFLTYVGLFIADCIEYSDLDDVFSPDEESSGCVFEPIVLDDNFPVQETVDFFNGLNAIIAQNLNCEELVSQIQTYFDENWCSDPVIPTTQSIDNQLDALRNSILECCGNTFTIPECEQPTNDPNATFPPFESPTTIPPTATRPPFVLPPFIP